MTCFHFRVPALVVVVWLALTAAPRAHVEPVADSGGRRETPADGPEASEGARVVLLVRHGETLADGSGDPPLSEDGRARAVSLARIASAYDVEAVFATPFRRTLGTAGPAAEWLGLRPQAVPVPPAGLPAHVSDVVARVRASDGPGVLVVGHSNTVPAIIESLTGIDVGPIGETEYNRLFVVVLPSDGPATVDERSY